MMGGERGVGWGWVGVEEREKENPIYSTHDLRIETRLSPCWSESRCWLVLQRMSARWNTSKCLCLIETTNMCRLGMDWEEKGFFFFFLISDSLVLPPVSGMCLSECIFIPHGLGVQGSGNEGQEKRSREPVPWASYICCSPTGLMMTTRTTRMGSLLAWECAPDSFKSLIYTS